MKKIGCREFKNRQGYYLKWVREGESLLLTDRGKPVAHVIPAPEAGSWSLEGWLKELEQRGSLRLGKKKFTRFEPVPAKGKPASRIIIEDRARDGR